MMRFLCPWCAKRLKSPKSWAGRVGRCTRCRGKSIVPDPLPKRRVRARRRSRKLPRGLMGLLFLGALAKLVLLSWPEMILEHLLTRLGR